MCVCVCVCVCVFVRLIIDLLRICNVIERMRNEAKCDLSVCLSAGRLHILLVHGDSNSRKAGCQREQQQRYQKCELCIP